MSSPQPWQASSSPAISPSATRRRKSRFTYKQLAQLAGSSSSSTSSPLRVVAHVDLDAFYAQCEMVRLGVPADTPLAVQQWQGLIAINYPARASGLSRHVTVVEARRLCPQLVCQHVATWREGDERWAYHPDAAQNIATHKVSLDPYRLESRRILACIKQTLPAELQRVEKASVDEVFMDLSAQIHSILLKRYPELARPAPYDDPTERLPIPPTTALDWKADALIDVDADQREEDDPDWDDIAMLIGSEIVRDVRAAVYAQLRYTCSGGVAHNKMLAKLGSGHKKPNSQTVVRNRAIQQFLSDFKFTKIRGMGGKLGDEVVAAYNTDTIREMLPVPLEQLKQKLGDDTGTWVYNIIRGRDFSEVNSRTQIKSMLSAKSFRPSINTAEQATRWLRIFVADIYSRLVEEGVVENKRRPRTINLHHRQGGQTRSKQIAILQGRRIDEAMLFDLAQTLLGQVILEGRVWPCANLSLSVAGFEDGVAGNLGIGAFLIKGDEAKMLREASREAGPGGALTPNGSARTPGDAMRSSKRPRLEAGISRFLVKSESTEDYDEDFGAFDATRAQQGRSSSPGVEEQKPMVKMHQEESDQVPLVCKRCQARSPSQAALQSHLDWHFAKDLHDSERPVASVKSAKKPLPHSNRKTSTLKASKTGKADKSQSKLAFG